MTPKLSSIAARAGMVRKYLYYKSKRTRLPYYPDRLYIESTNLCNLNCLMCPTGRGEMTREKGYMDFELFKSIIDEMAPHVKAVVLHIWGESLLDERIFEKIRYAKTKGVKTELSTNITLLDKKCSGEILDSGLDVLYLCMDGITKETYESVRRGAKYETIIANIEGFLKAKNDRGLDKPYTHMQIVDMKATHEEIEEFRRRWSVKGVDNINVKALDTWGGQIQEIKELGDSAPQSRARYHCPNLWYHTHIYWDGTLVCCDRDYNAANPLGNVRDGVMKAWNGEKMSRLREKHVEGDLDDVPSCSKCTEWSWWEPTLFTSWGNIPKKR